MKRIFTILGTFCLGLTLSAQPGIISTRPANPQDGKILTMEETILSRELTPAGHYHSWGQISAPSMTAFTKGQSLWLRDKDGNEKAIAESESKEITY